MTTTGRIAKAERKNMVCPTGYFSPRKRTNADITASRNAEITLSEIALRMFMIGLNRSARQAAARYGDFSTNHSPIWRDVVNVHSINWDVGQGLPDRTFGYQLQFRTAPIERHPTLDFPRTAVDARKFLRGI